MTKDNGIICFFSCYFDKISYMFFSVTKEFPIPDAKKLFVLWTSVSLAIIGAFLVVLAAIWKMDVLRDYRRMYWKSGDDEKQICKSSDVSMYPPVHQTVPTLFPNDLSVHHKLPFGL